VKSKLSKKEIIEDLKNVKEKVDGNLTRKKYDKKGEFSLCASCHNKVENLPVRIELFLKND